LRARAFASRLANPLAEPNAIGARLDEVEFLLGQTSLRDNIRAPLSGMPDLERALGRLSVRRGGPRDLWAVGGALATALKLAQLIDGATDLGGLPGNIAGLRDILAGADQG